LAVCRVRAGVARRSLIRPRCPANPIRLDIDHLARQDACWSRGTLVLLDDLHWADEETPACSITSPTTLPTRQIADEAICR
jgi:hypothetical protein